MLQGPIHVVFDCFYRNVHFLRYFAVFQAFYATFDENLLAFFGQQGNGMLNLIFQLFLQNL